MSRGCTALAAEFYVRLPSSCFSFVGRRGGGQTVSLSRQGCVFQQIIQHELLHAMGFNHEQTRSDRDLHVRILLQNVIRGGLSYSLNQQFQNITLC